MSLATGSRLGPYEILAPLGAGGMGEVYRARDTRLGRVVAVKVLPSPLSASDDVRQRFEREARTISQLSHPHICAIHDVGRQDGVDYLVMEFLEGETLAFRLAKGTLPLEQTLRWGAQIADALDRAHRQGIVHRDLKPANVMLTKSGVKLLDFGLAKEVEAVAASGDTALPTRASEGPLTEKGTILGTFQYMSPEQLEGKEADARSDIFALGAVLYEMVTGRKAFAGATQASLISSILRDEPQPISQVAPLTPPALERVLRTCLAKDPEDRWQSAGDVAKELRWIGEGSGAGAAAPQPIALRRRWRERVAWMAAALAAAAAISLAVRRPGEAPRVAGRAMRTNILLPERVQLNSAALSPAGDRVVFSGIDAEGRVQLWVRALDSYAAKPLAGTEGGILPFWSPDGRFIGFFADKKLKRIESSGGSALSLFDVDGIGGSWAPSGDILVAEPSGPILRVPSGGGKAVPVTKLDAARRETAHRYPFLLPDGRHFLYLALNIAGNARDPANRIWVGSIDGAPARALIPGNFNPQYGSGYLLFIRGGDLSGNLLAQPFDPVALKTSGEPVTVAEAIGLYGDFLGFGDFSVSAEGTLLFDSSRQTTRLEWFDRGGRQVGTIGEPAAHFGARISPDGSRIVFDVYDPRTNATQLWMADVARGLPTRLTSGDASNFGAVWSPDGARIVFQTDRRHQADIYVRDASSGGREEAVTDEDGQKFPQDWSSDGRFIVAIDREAVGSRLMQVIAVEAQKPHAIRVVLPRAPNDYGALRLSPDSRWLAYDLDESGRREIYVVSFPDGQGKIQVSDAGGITPRWTRGGREIVYTAPDGRVMSAAVDARNGFRASAPKPLFQLPEGASFGWDVSADGDRFLFTVPVVRSSSIPLSLVHNWTATLTK